jgi:hypothetical protein
MFSVKNNSSLAALLGCLMLNSLAITSRAQLALTSSETEIVITSGTSPTWKMVLAVARAASQETPGGGVIRALHVPANNPESLVGSNPKEFGHSAWGLGNLEWRYIPVRGEKGVRDSIGASAKIESLTVVRETPAEIEIEMTGHWPNVSRFTRRLKIGPTHVRTQITAEWSGPQDYRGMWWLMCLFKSATMNREGVSVRDEDTGPVPLPGAKENVVPLPAGVEFPYEVSFPLNGGPLPALRLRVTAFGSEDGNGLRYELWPETPARNPAPNAGNYTLFFPRWVAPRMERRAYVFDYEWRFDQVAAPAVPTSS